MPYSVIRHRIGDYATWRPHFDGQDAMRKAGGVKSARVFRVAGEPNDVVVLLEWRDLDSARRFAGSADLRQRMQAAGVVGKPEVMLLEEAT